ncbi:TGFB1 factor, partial [Origma solitaria]|nr:TGFB1 factor [Origma solitaria]
QGFGNSSWRFLQGRSVRVTAEDEWLWFDVTDSVRQWLRGSEALGVFRLSAHCPCEPGGDTDPKLHISIEGKKFQNFGAILGIFGNFSDFGVGGF